jgi:hypothetical protein
MGLGVAGLGASLAFWLIRTDALQGCTWDSNHGSCDTAQHAMAAQSTGRTFNVAAPIALGVGGALLVAGGVWWVAGAHRERSGVTAWIAPSREGAWAGIEGRF